MGMSIRDLDTCSPDAIDTVAATWERLSNAMVGDQAAIDRNVIAPLRDGGWNSKDGERAIQLIGWVGDQLEAIRGESGAMASILREAATDLRTAQQSLRTALADLAVNGMSLDKDDNVVWTAPSPDLEKATKATADALATRISGALRQADDADELAAATMRANTDAGKKLDFNVNSLGGDPIGDAIRLKDLYTKLRNGDEMSDQEMQQVRLLINDNQGDRAHQLTLMRELGPAGLLAVTAKTNAPMSVPDMNQDDLALIRSSLSTALAGASYDLARDDTWMTNLATAGGKLTATTSWGLGGETVFGYQSLNTLVRQGTFDPAFLTRATDDLLKFEKGGSNGRLWETLSPDGDPVAGLLTAMRNNPAAATMYFTDPSGEERLDYLVNERDTSPLGDAQRPYMGVLGETLVAAAPAQSTPDSVGVVSTVTNYFGTNPPQEIPGELKSHVAQMLANNVESVHEGIGEPTTRFIPEGQGGPLAHFDDGALTRTLAGLGGENMQPIITAENMFAVAGLNAIHDHSPDPEKVYAAFANDYAQTQGVLTAIAVEEVRSDAEGRQDAEAAKIEKAASIVGGAVTIIPGVGDVAERAVNWVAVDLTQRMNESVAAESAQKIADIYDPALPATREIVTAWMEQHNIPPLDSAVYTADMQVNFDASANRVNNSAGH